MRLSVEVGKCSMTTQISF